MNRYYSFMLVMAALLVGSAGRVSNGAGRQTSMSGESVPRGRVIYNLDCSEFFVGTFGPVVPETIDKFVDVHATSAARRRRGDWRQFGDGLPAGRFGDTWHDENLSEPAPAGDN